MQGRGVMAERPFTETTRSVLRGSGWTVGNLRARRSEGNARGVATAFVTSGGAWAVLTPVRPVILRVPSTSFMARGKESCAELAAMDANEVLWAWRDGRHAPYYLAAHITVAGAVLFQEMAGPREAAHQS